MTSRVVLRSSAISRELHESDIYYIVDYDFKGAHGQKPHPEYFLFYKKFEEIFGQKISKYRGTASVLNIPTLEMAVKIARLIKECGGAPFVRKCVRMDTEI